MQSIPQGQPPASLRLVYNNDTHQCWDNISRSVTAFRALSQEGAARGQDVLRLNSGDANTGTSARNWQLSVLLNNLFNFHAVTWGNHEFDLPFADLIQGLKQSNYTSLLSNINIPGSTRLRTLLSDGRIKVTPQVIRGQNGTYAVLGVAKIGLAGSDVLKEGVTEKDFQATCRALQAEVQKLQAQGINKIILLSGMGNRSDRRLAQSVAGIDVILGGDDHLEIRGIRPGENYLLSPTGEPVLITQSGAHGDNAGVADLAFTPAGQILPQSNTLMPTAGYAKDPTADMLIAGTIPPESPVAFFATPYQRGSVKTAPDPLAQFMADSARAISGADIGFVRAPEIRDSIPAGTLTSRQLEQILPYSDPVVRTSLTGRELYTLLQRSAAGVQARLNGGNDMRPLLHPSGLCYTISGGTGQAGNIMIFSRRNNQWESLQPDKLYSVALGDYIISDAGAKVMPELAHPERIQWHSNMPMREVLAWGFRQNSGLTQPFSLPELDGRLQVIP